MATEHVQKYLDRIESQHKTSPRYMAHVETLLELMDGAYATIREAPDKFDIATAEGDQLDIIGERVGADRTMILTGISGGGDGGGSEEPDDSEDEDYRLAILAQIAKNHWDGTEETFGDIWDSTIGRVMDTDYVDNQDMSVDLVVNGHMDDDQLELITAPNIVPRPMGVVYNYKNRLPHEDLSLPDYYGIAMYCTQRQYFEEADEAPDFEEENWLADGLGVILSDGRKVMMTS